MSTDLDSFHKAMAMEEVEQAPAIPIMAGWIAYFSGIPLKRLIRDPEAILKAQIYAQEMVGHDAFFSYTDPLYVPEAYGCSVVYRSPEILDAVSIDIKSVEDVEALPVLDVRKDGRFPVILRVAERLVGLPGRDLPVLCGMEGPFTNCARIMGIEKMMRALMKNRPLVERLLESIGKTMSHFGQALEEMGIDGLILADPVGSSTMVSPKVYGEVVFPSLERFIKGLTIPVIYHVCGDTNPILDMMCGTGARILSLDQCMDLAEAKQKVAGRCGIGGNVDPTNVLPLGTVEEVKRETLKCLRQGGKKGYILMSGCAVPPQTPVENLRTMVETAKLPLRDGL